MRAMSECAKWDSCSLKGGAAVFDAAFASHGRDGGGRRRAHVWRVRGESGNAQRMGRVLENGALIWRVFAASFNFFAIRTENGYQTGTTPPPETVGAKILEKWYMVQMQYFN